MPSVDEKQKALNLLGLARRARLCVSGSSGVESAIRGQKAHLIVVDQGASQATQKKYADMCAHYGIPLCRMEGLGQAIGREERISAAICDEGFARKILELQKGTIAGGKE